MCGICGAMSFNGRDASAGFVEKMMDVMAARGPDARGMFVQDGAALGHRRLKIFDLSRRSAQPMVDSGLGLAVVYNGAIYNYRQIRGELESRGYRFFSTGDTEVLLKAYHAWGEAALDRLNGMFAFAVWHRDTGELLLGRDRLGIKPLYYALTSGRFSFASTLPALLQDPGIDTDIDPVALHHYMSFHSVVPPPRTILKGVRKLPPATLMRVAADGTTAFKRYWELSFAAAPEEARCGPEAWKETLTGALDEAVQRRMTADVPVGVLLSGGLDSSLVVGLLARAGQSGLNTFSIGFESVGGETGDEFKYSDRIATHFGTRHHQIRVASKTVLPALESCVKAMSEPMVSHDCIGFYLLSREVSRHVKVVQSGQGADEVFAGYHWYPPMMQSPDPLETYARIFLDSSHDGYGEAVHPRFVEEDYSRRFVADHFRLPGAESGIDKALRIDTTVMLIDDPVKRVDNMTMAWGLEARVPFLDHELVSLAARMPAEYKVGGGGKYILKEAARDIIPHDVIDRPKGYFPVPALKYFRGEFFDFVQEILHAPRVEKRNIFNRDYIDRVLADPDAHITPLRGARLWQMALLEYWLTVHRI